MLTAKLNVPTASGLMFQGQGDIAFWSFLDTTSSSGSVFYLWDAGGPAGRIIGAFSTTAGQSFRDFLDKNALPIVNGVYFQLVSGAVAGQVTVRIDDLERGHHEHDNGQHVQLVADIADFLP